MSNPALRTRDLVLVPHHGKRRPMIVLYVEEHRFLAISGTGTLRDVPGVTVQPETRAGLTLRLYKPTHFYFSRLHVVDTRIAESTGRRCPIDLWLTLDAGVEPYRLNALAFMRVNELAGEPAYDLPVNPASAAGVIK